MSGLFNDDTLSLYLKLKEAMKQYVRDAMPGGVLNREIKPQDTLDAAALSLSPVPLVGDAAGLLADGYRYATDPSSRTPLNYGLSALGALPFVPAMGAVTAWHGSPHKFDKFDLSKIGTGEGAQAYGHGVYVAENPRVAQEYANTLSADRRGLLQRAISDAEITRKQRDYIVKVLEGKQPWPNNPHGIPAKRETLIRNLAIYDDLLESAKPLKASLADAANVYKVDLPDEYLPRMLDWDKPLSEQAKEVQAAFSDAGIRSGKTAQDIIEMFIAQGYSVDDAMRQFAKESAYENTGKHAYEQLVQKLGNRANASDLMRTQGIPGIRYLDGGSRGAGTGTSNFVVFDPEMIRILERNGEATGAKPWQPGEWEGLFKK